jgi:hypothetical protein
LGKSDKNMKNRKILYLALIITFIFSTIFAIIPSIYAKTPNITIDNDIVHAGDNVVVKGFEFPSSQLVFIFINSTDPQHYLGSTETSNGGNFIFNFVMQPNYPGNYTIIAICNSIEKEAQFTLARTYPVDDRIKDDLIEILDMIKEAQAAIIDDVELKAAWVLGNLTEAEMTLTTAIDGTETAIIDDVELKAAWVLGNLTEAETAFTTWSAAWTSTRASYLDYLNSGGGIFNDIQSKLNTLLSKTSNTAQCIAGSGVWTTPTTAGSHWHQVIWPPTGNSAAKVTITLKTAGVGAGESLQFHFYVGGGGSTFQQYKTIASGSNIDATTFEFCFSTHQPLNLYASVSNGIEVWYNYLIEYQPS